MTDDHSIPPAEVPANAPPDPSLDMDSALAAEIEAALGDMSIGDMLDDADRPPPPRGEREFRTGTVV